MYGITFLEMPKSWWEQLNLNLILKSSEFLNINTNTGSHPPDITRALFGPTVWIAPIIEGHFICEQFDQVNFIWKNLSTKYICVLITRQMFKISIILTWLFVCILYMMYNEPQRHKIFWFDMKLKLSESRTDSKTHYIRSFHIQVW